MEFMALAIQPLNQFLEFVSQPWHWAVSGVMISTVMFLLLYFGGEFGVSATLRTVCAVGGAGKRVSFFDFDWKSQLWNLVFVGGAVIGGFVASTALKSPEPVQVAESTATFMQEKLNVTPPTTFEEGTGFAPMEIFDLNNVLNPTNLVVLILGGFLVGFGARYAGGCTSGHAISGLSNLQLPSLIAVIGFFLGGLLMTYFILPAIL